MKIRPISILVLIISFLTFFLPGEVFHNHICDEVDIFCKSLDSIADSPQEPISIHSDYFIESIYFLFEKVFISQCPAEDIPIRAPPLS
jgi:hypothetical protein